MYYIKGIVLQQHIIQPASELILTGIKKLPDDDQLMIETCWSDFKCFNV
jgi:hypothetical protein